MSGDSLTIDIKGDESDLDKSLNESKGAVEDFGKTAKKVFLAIGAAIAVKKVFDFGKQLMSLYAEQEQAETRLESVLKATKNAAGFTSDEMKQMASSMQDMTTIGDEVILNAQAIIATFKNIRGDVFKDATMLAADMAEVLGSDLKGASTQVAKALNDPIKGVGALSDAGVSFTEQQKEMIKTLQESGDMVGAQQVILEELRGEFGGAASEAAKTFTGRMKQAWNTIGDVGEAIFSALVPALDALSPLFEGVINFIKNMSGSMVDNSSTLAGWAEGFVSFASTVASWITDKVIVAVSTMQIVWENAGEAILLAVNTMALGVVASFNSIVHFITVAIPEYLSWFKDNWKQIFTDIWNFTKTVFSNLWKNIVDFWEATKSFLSGDGFDFEFTNLTKGFESSIKELPKIAERELGPLEKELGDKVSKLQDSLGGKLDERIAKNKKKWSDMFKSASPDQKSFDEIQGSLPTDPFEATAKKEEKDKAEKEKSGKETEGKEFSSSTSGLEELNKRISDAAASSPQVKEQMKTNETLNDLLKSTTAAKDLDKKLDDDVTKWLSKQNDKLDEQTQKQSESNKTMKEAATESKNQTALLKSIADNIGKVGTLS